MYTHPSPLRIRIFMIILICLVLIFFLFGYKEFLDESTPSPNLKNDEIKLQSQVTEICACVLVITRVKFGGMMEKKKEINPSNC